MTFQGFIDWVIYSSENPDKLSLTIRGFLVGILPVLAFVFPHVDFAPVIESFVALVSQLLGLVSISMMIYGGIRKLWTTYKGTNAVINSGL